MEAGVEEEILRKYEEPEILEETQLVLDIYQLCADQLLVYQTLDKCITVLNLDTAMKIIEFFGIKKGKRLWVLRKLKMMHEILTKK